VTEEEISDAEVAEIRTKYEQDPMTCWFCRKKIPLLQEMYREARTSSKEGNNETLCEVR